MITSFLVEEESIFISSTLDSVPVLMSQIDITHLIMAFATLEDSL